MFRCIAVFVLVAVALAGCTRDEDRAAAVARELAQDIADRFDTPYGDALDAEQIASRIVLDRLGERVEMLGWEGHSEGPEGARLDVRIIVSLPETYEGGGFGSRTLPASESTRCWSIVVSSRVHALRTLREFACPDEAIARIPSTAPAVGLPDDVEVILVNALTGATAEDAHARVEAIFPPSDYTIVTETIDGIVVALGAPAVHDCAVALVDAKGGVTVLTGFPREALLPGEAGCSPDLLRMSPPA